MQIRAFFWPNPSILKYICSNLKPQPHPETEEQKLKSKLVSVTAIVNVAQTAKKATCLTTVTRYNSNSSLTPEVPSTRIRILSKTEIFFSVCTSRPHVNCIFNYVHILYVLLCTAYSLCTYFFLGLVLTHDPTSCTAF